MRRLRSLILLSGLCASALALAQYPSRAVNNGPNIYKWRAYGEVRVGLKRAPSQAQMDNALRKLDKRLAEQYGSNAKIDHDMRRNLQYDALRRVGALIF